jgi:hypothetical protein
MLTVLEPKYTGSAGMHISGRARVPSIEERNPNSRHRASARRLAGERLLTIQQLRDIDSSAVESVVRGDLNTQTLYLPVALRPAKTALTRYFASDKALVISACRVPC